MPDYSKHLGGLYSGICAKRLMINPQSLQCKGSHGGLHPTQQLDAKRERQPLIVEVQERGLLAPYSRMLTCSVDT